MAKAICFVASGDCRFTFGLFEVSLKKGEFAALPGFTYLLECSDDTRLISVYLLESLNRGSILTVDEQSDAPKSPVDKRP